jgi:uncharacterized membrane protein
MSDTFWIIGEIIVGIALLTILGSAIAVVLPRLTPEASGRSSAILDRRYARGELTREQYLQMREDMVGQDAYRVPQPNGHDLRTPPVGHTLTPT